MNGVGDKCSPPTLQRHRFNADLFQRDLDAWIGTRSLRAVQAQSGIPIAALSRIRAGTSPSLYNFLRFCDAMEYAPARYFYQR